jgi:hypothetical protein
VIDLWLVRAEAVRDGSLMVMQEPIANETLSTLPHLFAKKTEAEVAEKFRRHFSIEPDAVYWQLEQHIEMSSDD